MNTAPGGLVVPGTIGARIAAEVRRYGALDVETGGFMLAPAPEPMRVSIVALAGERGVTRRWGLFRVSGRAIDRLFAWADEQGMRIPAQFHSHKLGAFLSPTDQRDGFNVKDFISAVVPQYADPPADPTAWGWWLFDGEAWIATAPPAVSAQGAPVVVFDEDGVRADG